jgi:hypothetical protein
VPVDHVLYLVLLTLIELLPLLTERGTVEFLCEFFSPLVVQLTDLL